MKISFIKIKGFRNLKPTELKLDKEKSVFAFIGSNGHGKTNLLEAIYICALSKSFRTRTNLDLINFDQDFCTIVYVADMLCKMNNIGDPTQLPQSGDKIKIIKETYIRDILNSIKLSQ